MKTKAEIEAIVLQLWGAVDPDDPADEFDDAVTAALGPYEIISLPGCEDASDMVAVFEKLGCVVVEYPPFSGDCDSMHFMVLMPE